MSIETDIAAWDGKTADVIAKIFESYRDEPSFVDTLITLTKVTSHQKGATWLLKAWLDAGNKLENQQASDFFECLGILEHWETKLHALQSLPFLSVNRKQKQHVEVFLRTALTDKNKFVRAWAYNGFYELSKQHPEYRDETEQLLEVAVRNEAASVKARVRNLLRRGF